MGTLGTPALCGAGSPPGALVSWFNHLNHALSVLWNFLFSAVFASPVFGVKDLQLWAQQGWQGSLWSSLQELFAEPVLRCRQ